MRVLIICSGNSGRISPFISEQAEAIASLGNEMAIHSIKGKGVLGYLRNVPAIKRMIKQFSPDLIHAHYGLSGLAASMQSIVPVVITYHGSDAHVWYVRALSRVASRLADHNIFVAGEIGARIRVDRKASVIPCGVSLEQFFPMDMKEARNQLHLEPNGVYFLFSSAFDNKVKNYKLANSAIERLGIAAEFLELKNRSRREVNLLLNACDVFILTSYSEGSPQVIKEAMACNRPIVSTGVGDVKWLLGDADGCFLTSFHPLDVADKMRQALEFSRTVGGSRGRERIAQLHIDSEAIAERIIRVYATVIQ